MEVEVENVYGTSEKRHPTGRGMSESAAQGRDLCKEKNVGLVNIDGISSFFGCTVCLVGS